MSAKQGAGKEAETDVKKNEKRSIKHCPSLDRFLRTSVSNYSKWISRQVARRCVCRDASTSLANNHKWTLYGKKLSIPVCAKVAKINTLKSTLC